MYVEWGRKHDANEVRRETSPTELSYKEQGCSERADGLEECERKRDL